MHCDDTGPMCDVITIPQLQRRVRTGHAFTRRARRMVSGLTMTGAEVDGLSRTMPFVERRQDHLRVHLRDDGVEQAKALKLERAMGKALANPVTGSRSTRE